MKVEYRSIKRIILYYFITLSIYKIYWTVKTKKELLSLGPSKIPTAFLIIIPLIDLYFWYKYSKAYAQYVSKDDEVLAYFLLSFMPLAGMMVFQLGLNKIAKEQSNYPKSTV